MPSHSNKRQRTQLNSRRSHIIFLKVLFITHESYDNQYPQTAINQSKLKSFLTSSNIFQPNAACRSKIPYYTGHDHYIMQGMFRRDRFVLA